MLTPTAASVAAPSGSTATAGDPAGAVPSTMSSRTLAAAVPLSAATLASIAATVATLLLHAQYGQPSRTKSSAVVRRCPWGRPGRM